MKDERDQDREPKSAALFLFLAHFGAALAALLFTPRIISHIAGPNNLPAARVLARMMKQILLRVASVFAEIPVAKFAEFERGDLSLPRKILLLEHSFDPDIDRKCAKPFVGEEHHAVRDLCPHARQLAKPRAQLPIRQLAPCFEVRFATRHESRGS